MAILSYLGGALERKAHERIDMHLWGGGAGNDLTFSVSIFSLTLGPAASHLFYFNSAKEFEHMASLVDVLTVTLSRLPSLILLLAGIQLSV